MSSHKHAKNRTHIIHRYAPYAFIIQPEYAPHTALTLSRGAHEDTAGDNSFPQPPFPKRKSIDTEAPTASGISLFQALQKNSPPKPEGLCCMKFATLDSIAGRLGFSFMPHICIRRRESNITQHSYQCYQSVTTYL